MVKRLNVSRLLSGFNLSIVLLGLKIIMDRNEIRYKVGNFHSIIVSSLFDTATTCVYGPVLNFLYFRIAGFLSCSVEYRFRYVMC